MTPDISIFQAELIYKWYVRVIFQIITVRLELNRKIDVPILNLPDYERLRSQSESAVRIFRAADFKQFFRAQKFRSARKQLRFGAIWA